MDESVQPQPRVGTASASAAAPYAGNPAGTLMGLGPEPGDDALLARIAQGDRQAFALLAARHAPKAMKLAQRVLGNAADADEVVQEAMLRVWTGAKNWIPDGRARFSTWLHRVVVNLCVDRRRRPAFAGLDGIPEPPDPTPSAVNVMARQQTAKLVSQALAELPERQRLAVTLCYYEERSAADAAQILSLSVSAVESLLARARRALRARLSSVVQDTGEV
ncbi:RNA polymerase sigma factor [Nitrospirillum amazonense]|uniref:RNA polymerase sigma factor n=1 Tax=Nitrospirillum amazonense TaxID=28077 RepID=UPI0024124D68|nr:RNA polymerase sigma factor [Nitrospirillum amazonense]MDG3440572.1 RNA polymerase sigma factor [Nitrospirillum amazonense]